MSELTGSLPHRAVLALSGPDTIALLERLVTNTTTDWAVGEARYGALLTPQGKIIADFIALRTDGGVLLDVHRDALEDLARRLKLFRLRAKVDIAPAPNFVVELDPQGFADPRSDGLPNRVIRAGESGETAADIAVYDTARIAAGVAEFGADFVATDVFPGDINMDRMGGVDYSKGCFVGQEVVSRMYRRGKIRKRTIAATGEGLAAGDSVTAGEASLGEVTSVAGGQGLVRLRIDRLAKALDAGTAVTSAGRPVDLSIPDWLADEMAAQLGDD